MSEDTRMVRYIVVKGIPYMRVEDAAVLIRDLGATEETDVRNRLDEAAGNLESAGFNRILARLDRG